MGGVRPNASENGQISPSTTVRAVRGDGSCPKLASILPEGRKTANICPNSGVIRGIPDNTRLTHLTAPSQVHDTRLTHRTIPSHNTELTHRREHSHNPQISNEDPPQRSHNPKISEIGRA